MVQNASIIIGPNNMSPHPQKLAPYLVGSLMWVRAAAPWQDRTLCGAVGCRDA